MLAFAYKLNKNPALIIISKLFIRRLLILHFLRHTEFISASLLIKEVLKQVQDDVAIYNYILSIFSFNRAYFN